LSLGLAGFIPGLGVAADVADAAWYAAEGDYVDAAVSAVAAVPGYGDAIAVLFAWGELSGAIDEEDKAQWNLVIVRMLDEMDPSGWELASIGSAGKKLIKLRAKSKLAKSGKNGKKVADAAENSGSAAARSNSGCLPVGEEHHAISKRIHRELEGNPGTRGHFVPRDPRFVVRAKDGPSHRGYQRWHRELDYEIRNWVIDHRPSIEQFIREIERRYDQPDLRDRFPGPRTW